MPPKNPKPYTRPFQELWTTEYGFVSRGEKAICSLCFKDVVCRTSSIKRHFESIHASELNSKPKEEQVEIVKKAVLRYTKQSCYFRREAGAKNKSTEASFVLAKSVIENAKPFTDGEYLKTTFYRCAEVLFGDLPNKNTILARIKDMPASRRTIERRMTDMVDDVVGQQTVSLRNAEVFSVALDESVDLNDIPRLAVVARFSQNGKVYEELCCLAPLFNTTTGEDILLAFVKFFEKQGVDLNKVFAVTTDGAPAMVGKHREFVKLLEERIGRNVMKVHCIIHQENLCAKLSNSSLNDVMLLVTKIVNFLVARSSTIHRQFRNLLNEYDSCYGDIPVHCNIRWLSRGKVLNRFIECFSEIKMFLTEKGQVHPELSNDDWVVKLMFLADITEHLNELNVRLQGKGQTILSLYESWLAFVAKLKMFNADIQKGNLQYFKNLQKHVGDCDVNLVTLKIYMSELVAKFCNRFQEFQRFGPVFVFLIQPEICSNIDLSIFEWLQINEFRMQIIDFKTSALWVAKFADLRKSIQLSEDDQAILIAECWDSLPPKFSSLKRVAKALLSAFGSTYICEQIFSQMKNILSPNRNRLTVDHSEACVVLKVTNFPADIFKLSISKQKQDLQ